MLAALVVYNSNAREVASFDSQPTKFAARELALHGRLTLDAVVARAPALGARSAFQRDLAGRYRSAYSVIPAIEAAAVGWLLHRSGVVDLDAPLAPRLVASLTASMLTAAGVALVFLALARHTGARPALVVAAGLGFGTNLWPLASRSLWQLETVCFGLGLALYAWLRPAGEIRAKHVLLGAAGLALSGTARLETAPMVAVLLAGLVARLGVRRALPGLLLVAAAAGTLMYYQWTWFGSVLGAKMLLQSGGLAVHGVGGTLNERPMEGVLGLLVSPSRGLLVFSPILMVPLIGAIVLWRRTTGNGERWWTAAAAIQFVLYACYSMWWGGHTYGPRYLVDALVPLAPAAAAGLPFALRTPPRRALASAALLWSIGAAATGAFCYPHDRWNSEPADVDRHHIRLWDWSDPQIVRCWRRGPSPQNFELIDREAFRPVSPP